MENRRGRPSKKKLTPEDDELSDIVEGIRYAYILEDKDSLYEQMMRLKTLSQEQFPSEGLDRVLAKSFQMNTNSKDFKQKQADERLVQEFYYDNPQLLGFSSIDEFVYVSTVTENLAFITAAYQNAKDKGRLSDEIILRSFTGVSVEKAYLTISAEADKIKHLYSKITPYRHCLSGIPRFEDIQHIVRYQKLEHPTENETHLNQSHKEGELLANRLRTLLKIKEAAGNRDLIFEEFLKMKRGKRIPII